MKSNKCYIERIKLTDTDNPNTWFERNENKFTIIGYYLKDTLLTLYLLNNINYSKKISLDKLKEAYNHHIKTGITIFHNPPIEEWILTKENWCKRIADKVSKQFNMTFDDALSEVYFNIVTLYKNPKVYIGSLLYIQRSIYNRILMNIRYAKRRLQMTSLDEIVNIDDEGEMSLGDIIGEEDTFPTELEYKEEIEGIKQIMKKSFSDREINEICNYTINSNHPLYRRLLSWRKKYE